MLDKSFFLTKHIFLTYTHKLQLILAMNVYMGNEFLFDISMKSFKLFWPYLMANSVGDNLMGDEGFLLWKKGQP